MGTFPRSPTYWDHTVVAVRRIAGADCFPMFGPHGRLGKPCRDGQAATAGPLSPGSRSP